MAHLEQELEVVKEELRQVRDLTRLSVATFSHPLYFPSLETPAPEHFPKSTCPPQIPLANSVLPSITPTNLPNPDKQTLYVPNYANGPPNSPRAVRTTPNLSLPNQAGTMSAYLIARHRLGSHVLMIPPPNVNNNPPPNHRNQRVNMVTLDEEYDMRGTIVPVGNTRRSLQHLRSHLSS
ncbi:hypothetical protein HAX54_040459 [Datura stramonium]|uniref:Uncharacterized protein n=1 Tax=Datura stramonium TaxID=4076 RepID=A0ABS8SKF2_DATST|nr:hypothetical protein [Datura stramonium]